MANEVATIDQVTAVKAAKKAVREEAKKAAFKRCREGQDQGREGPQSGDDTTVVVRGDSSDEGPPHSTAPSPWVEESVRERTQRGMRMLSTLATSQSHSTGR